MSKVRLMPNLNIVLVDAITEEFNKIQKHFDNRNVIIHGYDTSTAQNIFMSLNKLSNTFDIVKDVTDCLDSAFITPYIESPSDINDIIQLDTIICDTVEMINTISKPFAKLIADIQYRADKIYYADNPPKVHNNQMSGNVLNELIPLISICRHLGIEHAVYDIAYSIYDFRNSGKDGYTLKDGTIQKME